MWDSQQEAIWPLATATSFDQRTYEPIDDVDKVSCRPDFAVAVYSGYLKEKESDELAAGLKIPAGTPADLSRPWRGRYHQQSGTQRDHVSGT